MKKTERVVYYYDLSISASSRTFEAPASISVKKAFELMESVPLAERNKKISNGREFLYVSDWEWTDQTISILINKSDKTMSDPVFTVPQENRRRTAQKEEEEGQDFSVHLLIKLPINDHAPALILIESCLGLTIFTVQKLLNQILADAKKIQPEKFTQIHPDGEIDNNGKPKRYNVTFKCAFNGHISDDLKFDLDHGKVQSIELITDKDQHTGFDEIGYIEEKCKTLVLTTKDENHPYLDKYNHIKALFNRQSDTYGRARIKFKTSTGLNRTVEMNTSEGLAQAYVKREKLDGFEVDLKSSYDAFNEAILTKMKELINQGA